MVVMRKTHTICADLLKGFQILFRWYCMRRLVKFKTDYDLWIAILYEYGWYVLSMGEHITDPYITETDTTQLENLSHNMIDTFTIET